MKKVLFLSVILAIGMTGFAQKSPVKKSAIVNQASVHTRVMNNIKETATQPMSFENTEVLPKASIARSGRAFTEYNTMTTKYDLQSNSSIGNRIAVWPDGTAAVVATWGLNEANWPDRGTGYNYFNGEAFGEEPSERVESERSGWPTIAPVGNGEILASHASGVNVYKRATKGEGEWETVGNFGNAWPRIASSGNGQYVHLVMGEQDENKDNYVFYSRSTDGGTTFSNPAYPPQVDVEGMYRKGIGADDYIIATNGDNVAILFTSMNYDLFYIISHDNGETWEKQIVSPFPYEHALDWNQTAITPDTDTIWCCDNSASIAIDNNGVVHVVFGLGRFAPKPESGAGYYTYWPYTDAIVYWNSEYVNEQGGHEIPLFGSWSGDANHPEWSNNGTNGVSNTLKDERLLALAEADGNSHLHLFGWPDENGDGQVDYTELWNNGTSVSYRTLGISTLPGISVDEMGNIAIIYSVLSESRTESALNFYYRSAYMTYKDHTGTWFDDVENLSADFAHSSDEVYYTTACANGKNGSFWVYYSADTQLDLFLNTNSAQTTATDNIIYAVKVTPNPTGWNVNKVVNPMNSVNVYPNPAQNVLYIDVNASQASDMNVTVYNITGQKVLDQSVSALSTGVNTRNINISNLTSGVYFVTVTANGFQETKKFVVR